MTLVAAVKTPDGGVIVGWDSSSISGWDTVARVDQKGFRHTLGDGSQMVVGYSWSYRAGQLASRVTPSRNPAPLTGPRLDAHDWLIDAYVPELRRVLDNGGALKKQDNVDEGTMLLIALDGRIFTIETDFQVVEVATPFWAIGCGAEVVRGALDAQLYVWTSDPQQPGPVQPALALDRAMRTAVRLNAGVRAPFHFELIGAAMTAAGLCPSWCPHCRGPALRARRRASGVQAGKVS